MYRLEALTTKHQRNARTRQTQPPTNNTDPTSTGIMACLKCRNSLLVDEYQLKRHALRQRVEARTLMSSFVGMHVGAGASVASTLGSITLATHQTLRTAFFEACVRGSIVVSTSACHAEDPGSIPGRGGCCSGSLVLRIGCFFLIGRM